MGLLSALEDGKVLLGTEPNGGESPRPLVSLLENFEIFIPSNGKWIKIPEIDWCRYTVEDLCTKSFVLKYDGVYYCGDELVYDMLGDSKQREFTSTLIGDKFRSMSLSGIPFESMLKMKFLGVWKTYLCHAVFGGEILVGEDHEAKGKPRTNLRTNRRTH